MLRMAVGMVARVMEKRQGMQIIEVQLGEGEQKETAQAISFADEAYEPGEILILNTTAIRLKLGTGGFHLVVAKAGDHTERDLAQGNWGHVMKMRYAPWQLAVDTVEEQASPFHQLFLREDLSLEATPVIIGELHSLLPVVAAALKCHGKMGRIAYVMPDAASLPASMSRHVQQLKAKGMLDAVITTGHAWGGDREAVTIHSGLLAARHIEKADVILCMLGPGVAGTGTPYGFSGVQLSEVVHAVSVLGGIPYFLPRLSFADPRPRHRGVSHHTLAILGRYVLRPVLLLMPKTGGDREQFMRSQIASLQDSNKHVVVWGECGSETRLEDLEQEYGLPFTSMGRGWREDPIPFLTAVLAADQAVLSLGYIKERINGGSDCSASPDMLAALGLYLTRNEGLL